MRATDRVAGTCCRWSCLGIAREPLIDSKFLPPYLSLASMAFAAQDWPQVLNLTNHIGNAIRCDTPTSPVTSWISIRWTTQKFIL